ncbi:hypothetical protein BC939DRAFT_441474 [Gamsiella multidivaricata]|uniref:uncharacterized protein n=1 Tax=Gamsiella multidivaricata TaxID=101098 RepID=UPI00221F4E28|nr:uncharacterized protein BC939DRAFT_441474 [Gamsiella multidivaricata]KAI7829684.1 hypothetical protein BC939DRAFT_441474 [Gamsiella multidivaricata]
MNPEHEDSVITKDLRRQFHRDGFLIVRNALDHEEVEVFRREVDCLVNFLISENIDIMKDYGGVIEPISCGYIDPPVSQMYILSKRPYSALRNLVTEDPDTVVPVLFGKMPALAKHLLPTDTSENPLCLFNEQYIVKTPKSASISSFAWHQDSQYMDSTAQTAYPIVSCWTALDDVNISNGTLLIEPFPIPIDPTTGERLDLPNSLDDLDTHLQLHRGLASLYQGELDRDKALVQAQEKDPFSMLKHKAGRPINVSDPEQWMKRCERQRPVLVDISAGSIVFLSGFVRHCSLGNTSSKFRRAYMPQFSAGKVVTDDGGIVSLAVPCTDHLHDRDQDMDAV